MRSFVFFCDFFVFIAPLAQLDRVPVFGTGGSGSNPARGKFFFAICFDALLIGNVTPIYFLRLSHKKSALLSGFFSLVDNNEAN